MFAVGGGYTLKIQAHTRGDELLLLRRNEHAVINSCVPIQIGHHGAPSHLQALELGGVLLRKEVHPRGQHLTRPGETKGRMEREG